MRDSDESTVVLAHHYAREGHDYKPGDTLTLPTADARALVAAGYASSFATPLVDDDDGADVLVRSEVAARVTAAGGTVYAWPAAGDVVPVRADDAEHVLALPGFTRVGDEDVAGGPEPVEGYDNDGLAPADIPLEH